MALAKRHIAIATAALTLLITYLHYSTNRVIHSQHDLYRELYYLPVLLAALAFGLSGALSTYVAVLALYLPYVARNWTGDLAIESNVILHLVLQGCIAVIAGFLIDRDRKRRAELAKEQYLAGIGRASMTIVHDVKSPLIAILGFARRLKERRGNVDSAVDAIIDSAEHIEKITHDALDFAKPLDLELQRMDLGTIIREAYTACRPIADAAGVELSLDPPPYPIAIPADSARLERAIINLVCNAVEASRKGQVVSIRAAVSGGRSVLTIRDSGSGMDGETIENLFVPFYTKKGKGTGIGMSIAKKVIDAHNGEIRVRSRPGYGTEISLELPIDHAPEPMLNSRDDVTGQTAA